MEIKFFALGVVILAFAKFTHGAPREISTASPQYPEGISAEKCDRATSEASEAGLVDAKFRIYEETGECHFITDTGPCEQHMFFVELEGNKTYGFCDCDRRDEKRLLIRHEEKKECYYIFAQAYCNDGEYLMLNEEDKPICATNKCADKLKAKPGSVFINLAPENSSDFKCREVDNHESTDDYCLEGETLQFVSGYALPQCRPSAVSHNSSPTEVDKNKCDDPDKSASKATGCLKDRKTVVLRVGIK